VVRDKVLRETTYQPIGKRRVIERTANVQAAPHAELRFVRHPPCQWLKYLPRIVDGISDKQNLLNCFRQQRVHDRRRVAGWDAYGLGSRQNQVIPQGRWIRVLSFVRQDIGHHGNLLSPPALIQKIPDAFGQL
jgi:hypothetical protein